jgi:hypothetical protein
MTKPIDLTDEFRRNVKRSSWTFDMIFNGFIAHINSFQSLDEWNQLALSNSIEDISWQHMYALAQGFNDYGEEIVAFYPEAIIRPADQAMNTIKEFIDNNIIEFFYENYGLNAHNLLLEFIIYLGVRLNTTFDSFLVDVHKFILDSGMDPMTTEYTTAFEMYYDACDRQNCGTKRERNLHKFAYYSLKPLMAKEEFNYFCKLIYSANLCRCMNRFTLGALDDTDQPHRANPFGFAPTADVGFTQVISNPAHEFGTTDFLAVHYGHEVKDFHEGLLLEAKLEQFIPRDDLLLILENPFDSYFQLVNIFLVDHLPNFLKFNKFAKANKVCQAKIEKSFYVWAQKKDNQDFILDVISHNIETSDKEYLWYLNVDNAFLDDNASNRMIISKLVDVERKSVMALNSTNWQLLADEYHRFFNETFVDQIRQSQKTVETKEVKAKVQENLCFQSEPQKVEPRKKFVYVPANDIARPIAPEKGLDSSKEDWGTGAMAAIQGIVAIKTFKELFPDSLFVFDDTKIDEFYLEQSNVRSVIELVSNAFGIAKSTAPKNSNILHRFVAITLFPDTFLATGAIIPKGKVKVFQANQYPYLEGDVEIIASQKVRMFMRTENSHIRIVSFGNPNYH